MYNEGVKSKLKKNKMQITIRTPDQLKRALPKGALLEISESTGINYSTVKYFRNKEVIAKAKEILARENSKTI